MSDKHSKNEASSRIENSPERKKRSAAKRRRENKRWQSLNGPITVSYIKPDDDEKGTIDEGGSNNGGQEASRNAT